MAIDLEEMFLQADYSAESNFKTLLWEALTEGNKGTLFSPSGHKRSSKQLRSISDEALDLVAAGRRIEEEQPMPEENGNRQNQSQNRFPFK